ncbi:DUF6207 family protein [Streptomyces tauricus]|uniref:DUF6207 family protein n=1 Tax=Streptomyces tauricus TaxID=68274 RepID=UPI00381D8F46
MTKVRSQHPSAPQTVADGPGPAVVEVAVADDTDAFAVQHLFAAHRALAPAERTTRYGGPGVRLRFFLDLHQQPDTWTPHAVAVGEERIGDTQRTAPLMINRLMSGEAERRAGSAFDVAFGQMSGGGGRLWLFRGSW